jgi:putative transposase
MSRYRLNPTPAQETVLREHCGHARYVWNLAVEQHSCWDLGRIGAPGGRRGAKSAGTRDSGHL